MIMLDTLANHKFLDLEKVLDTPIEDSFAYADYLAAKNIAEEAQFKFDEQIRKTKKH